MCFCCGLRIGCLIIGTFEIIGLTLVGWMTYTEYRVLDLTFRREEEINFEMEGDQSRYNAPPADATFDPKGDAIHAISISLTVTMILCGIGCILGLVLVIGVKKEYFCLIKSWIFFKILLLLLWTGQIIVSLVMRLEGWLILCSNGVSIFFGIYFMIVVYLHFKQLKTNF